MAADVGPVYIGADIGGTKTLVLACDADGAEIHREGFPTPQSLATGLKQLMEAIERVSAGAPIAAIGISIGGPIDRERDTVSPLHQPEWRDVPLRQLLQERFRCPCRIEVDTDAAALGEWYFGGVRDSPLVYVTLSTGVGGALLLEGSLYRGADGYHPELGHQVVPNEFGDPHPVTCSCGATNCLEALISGRALQQRFGCTPAQLPKEVWNTVGRILGHGLRNIAALYAPKRIVLGGGITVHAAAYLLPVAQATLQEDLRIVPQPEVSVSRLDYETALWGAVAVAMGYNTAPPGA
ncbi:MAG: ROK family protein [Candidatus Kapabacteria bacterium]|nr:ROK family protein [Candidatus Kapabacteria bacterium]MDW8011907.1 ROK family protein [Bacteroidota bacterium]